MVVQGGREPGDTDTPSGDVTPVTQEASHEPSGKLQTIGEERRRSVSDLEKGLGGSEEGTLDAKGEKDEIEEGYVKKD